MVVVWLLSRLGGLVPLGVRWVSNRAGSTGRACRGVCDRDSPNPPSQLVGRPA